MPRRRPLSSCLVSCVLAALSLPACGPPPAAQAGDGSTKPSETTEVVVPVPEPTATATASTEPPVSDVAIPSRPSRATSPVEPCIARLRDDPGGSDPAKATGAVEYHDALAAERGGKPDVAKRGFLKLIQNYPQSTLIPAGYFAFGEMFSEEAKLDPSKVPLAEQSYMEVLKYPSAPGSVHSVANYKLGLVLRATKGQQALAAFVKAIKADRDASTDACAAEVSKAATEASAEVFAAVGQPDKCWSFYLGITGDGARAAAACLAVAETFLAQNKPEDAAKVLAASVDLGARAQLDDAAKGAYCKRAKAAAAGAQASAGANATLARAVAGACKQ